MTSVLMETTTAGGYESLEKRLKMRPKKLRRALDKLSPVTHQATMSSSVLRSADGESIVQVRQ